MKIFLTGANGQVGWELRSTLAPVGDITAHDVSDLDLTDTPRVIAAVRAAQPDVIVNAAAHTAVDSAESDREGAFAVNATAPGVLAQEARRAGALFVHYSTDYVFNGEKSAPYVEEDVPAPINVYGESKLAGERAVAAAGGRYLILRTSWVYGPRGRNFFLTMRRIARERKELRVVDDQVGAPTSSPAIACATAQLIAGGAIGVYHMTALGETSWCGFARAILARAGIPTPVVGIRTEEYPTPARRPRNSRLDCSRLQRDHGVALPSWEEQLAEVTLHAP